MKLAVIALEYIGEHQAAYEHLAQKRLVAMGADRADVRQWFGTVTRKPWVARLTGLDTRYGLARSFLPGQIDYSQANSIGSRGVMLYFHCPPGLYEVFERVSWKRSERWYCRVGDGAEIIHLTREEVVACLSEGSA